MINGLDLFTGIGGLTLALSDWVKPVAYCEIDRYAQGVIRSRIAEGYLPFAMILDDVRKIDGNDFKGKVDIIYGGFPCQDISVAGNGKGLAGQRSGLFFEIMRLAKEIEPSFIFLENVPAIRLRGLSEVGHQLANLGYDCRWLSLSAQEIGAPHKRERWFMLGYANHKREGEKSEVSRGQTTEPHRGFVADTDSNGGGRISRPEQTGRQKIDHGSWWASEPAVGRMANGIPHRLDRIKCLGNGVVPIQAKEAFKRLIGFS